MSERQALAQYLEQHKEQGCMTQAQTQGYLFALLCAPAPVEFEQWVGDVFAHHHEQLDEAMLFALLSEHQALGDAIYEHGFQLTDYVVPVSPWHYNTQPSSALHQWAKGFNQGADYYVPELMQSQQLDEEHKAMLVHATRCLGLFAHPDEIASLAIESGQDKEAYCAHVFELMQDFSAGFAGLIEVVAMQSGLFEQQDWDDA